MSFELPQGWNKSKDIYSLPNGQGMVNIENYLSDQGEVISLFAVERDPDEFLQSYNRVAKNLDNITGKFSVLRCPSIKYNGFIFPVYIISGHGDKNLLMVQVFVNCGDCLGCFMTNIHKFNGSFNEAIKTEHVLGQLVKILKSIE